MHFVVDLSTYSMLFEVTSSAIHESALAAATVGGPPLSRDLQQFSVADPCALPPDADAHIRRLFEWSFLTYGRVSNVTSVLAFHPTYLECFLNTYAVLQYDEGPLPVAWRAFVSIMASASSGCTYYVRRQQDTFLAHGGDPAWLAGLTTPVHASTAGKDTGSNTAAASSTSVATVTTATNPALPTKIAALSELNALLAHRPWMITPAHIKALTSGSYNLPGSSCSGGGGGSGGGDGNGAGSSTVSSAGGDKATAGSSDGAGPTGEDKSGPDTAQQQHPGQPAPATSSSADPTASSSWSINELVHAIVIMTAFHSTCSVIQACGICREPDNGILLGQHPCRPVDLDHPDAPSGGIGGGAAQHGSNTSGTSAAASSLPAPASSPAPGVQQQQLARGASTGIKYDSSRDTELKSRLLQPGANYDYEQFSEIGIDESQLQLLEETRSVATTSGRSRTSKQRMRRGRGGGAIGGGGGGWDLTGGYGEDMAEDDFLDEEDEETEDGDGDSAGGATGTAGSGSHGGTGSGRGRAGGTGSGGRRQSSRARRKAGKEVSEGDAGADGGEDEDEDENEEDDDSLGSEIDFERAGFGGSMEPWGMDVSYSSMPGNADTHHAAHGSVDDGYGYSYAQQQYGSRSGDDAAFGVSGGSDGHYGSPVMKRGGDASLGAGALQPQQQQMMQGNEVPWSIYRGCGKIRFVKEPETVIALQRAYAAALATGVPPTPRGMAAGVSSQLGALGRQLNYKQRRRTYRNAQRAREKDVASSSAAAAVVGAAPAEAGDVPHADADGGGGSAPFHGSNSGASSNARPAPDATASTLQGTSADSAAAAMTPSAVPIASDDAEAAAARRRLRRDNSAVLIGAEEAGSNNPRKSDDGGDGTLDNAVGAAGDDAGSGSGTSRLRLITSSAAAIIGAEEAGTLRTPKKTDEASPQAPSTDALRSHGTEPADTNDQIPSVEAGVDGLRISADQASSSSAASVQQQQTASGSSNPGVRITTPASPRAQKQQPQPAASAAPAAASPVAAAPGELRMENLRYRDFDTNEGMLITHDFSWEEHGYALVSRFYPAGAPALDRQVSVICMLCILCLCVAVCFATADHRNVTLICCLCAMTIAFTLVAVPRGLQPHLWSLLRDRREREHRALQDSHLVLHPTPVRSQE